ncbi:ABC-three component system middle component 6 [Burkholderia gladioli]|uniref:ABC-three component system middle component 6 n=1 Tax=Burkholderia gladioli TaxID=28095 RepID=UPI002FE2D184
MILPTKYLSHDRALITVGGEILRYLAEPRSVSALWDCIRETRSDNTTAALISFDWFVLALNLLYAISAIDYRDGIVYGVKTA